MLRFLFKSQLSDRNALPFYIALKTPVCMHGQKKKQTKKTAATQELICFRGSFQSVQLLHLYASH